MATIHDFINQWRKALTKEADYLKSKGGVKHTITEGKCLTKNGEGATYWFTLVSDILLPDGSPVRIEYNGVSIQGTVISVEGFDVVIQIEQYMGEFINEATLFSEPWELLLALAKQLELLKENPTKLSRIQKLITAKAPAKHPIDKADNPVKELTLRAKYNATTYVWGPPGTGKTYTLARMIASRYKNNKNVLVLSHSNAAVDVLMLELAEVLKAKDSWKTGDIVRYGSSTDPKVRGCNLLAAELVENYYPDLNAKQRHLEEERTRLKRSYGYKSGQRLSEVENQLKRIRRDIKKQEAEYVENAKVVGVTLSKAAMDSIIHESEYDLIVVDEASMAYVPQIAFAASLGKKIVVCGDFKQLPPIAMSNDLIVEKWLKRDIFEVTKIVDDQVNHNLLMLTKQRRMHPDISSFTNRYIYENKVFDHPSVVKQRCPIASKRPFPNEAAVMVDLSSMGAFALKESSSDSRYNLFSALMAIQLILTAKSDGIDSIGYISPFKAQARLVNALIQDLIPDNQDGAGERKIQAATVHKFQGSERDFILFDNVDSYPQSRASRLLTDKASEKLINVAVTRARGKFINLADKKYIESRTSKNQPVVKLSNHLSEKYHVYTRHELPEILMKKGHPNISWSLAEVNEQLLKDILKAKKIIISASIPTKINNQVWQALKRMEQKAQITLVTPNREGIGINRYNHVQMDLVMPFIEIDNEILWVGTPVMNTNFQSSPKPPFLQCRVVSKKAVKLFQGYLDLKPTFNQPDNPQPKVVSYRPSFTLEKYLKSWDQCPSCSSIRKIQTQGDSRITLQCDYCGNRQWMNQYILQKYLEYTNLKCQTCNQPIDAAEYDRKVVAECSRCKEQIDVKSLL